LSNTPHISPEDLALLALGALPPKEAAACDAHIAACELCRHDLAEILGDLSLLALSAPPLPLPTAARERFLTSIGASSYAAKQPAVSSTRIAAPAGAPVASQPAASQPVVSQPAATSSVVAMPVRPAASSAPLRVWQAIAAVLLIALGFHMYKVHQLEAHLYTLDNQIAILKESNESLSTSSVKARQALQMLTAPNAQHVLLTAAHTAPEPEGRLTYIADSGSLLFLANHLKPLPADKAYELWIIPTSGAPIPAGVFHPDLAGNGSVVLPQIPQGVQAKAFGVTTEQATGSPTPTTPILISGAAS